MDDLVNAKGVQVWKVYPSTKIQDMSFTVTCHDTKSWFHTNYNDGTSTTNVEENTYDDYRQMARDPQTLDGPNSRFSTYTHEVCWYIIVPREYDYTAFFAGQSTGTDDTSDARIDVKEVQGTFKFTSHQKWLFYEKDETLPDDVSGL